MTGRLSRAALLLVLPALAGLAACHPRPASVPAAAAAPGAWSALYKCRILREGSERTFRAALLVGVPDRFRMELFGPVGGPRLLLASDGERLSAVLPGEQLQAEAEANPRSFQVLLGIPLEGADLLALLDGRLLTRADGRPPEVVRRLAGGGTARYQITWDPSGRPLEAEIAVRGAGLDDVTFHVAYGAPLDTGAGRLPSEIRLSRRDRGLVLLLREARVREAPEGAFHLAVPAGYTAGSIEEFASAGWVLFGDGTGADAAR